MRACRLRAQKRLEDLAPQLHIRQAFLEAIENGRYELLPGPVYAQGFVRAYAESLGLDGDAVAARFKRKSPAGPPSRRCVSRNRRPTVRRQKVGSCCWVCSSPSSPMARGMR
ncbi:MAG: helix-turn-helix domain-containing protein [Defluviicoccus sp.]|nr:MAG: helix-turn-helix domain-containing protein [Defluviicoccus sp.]